MIQCNQSVADNTLCVEDKDVISSASPPFPTSVKAQLMLWQGYAPVKSRVPNLPHRRQYIRTSELSDAKNLRRQIFQTSCPNFWSKRALVELTPLPHLSPSCQNYCFLESTHLLQYYSLKGSFARICKVSWGEA